VSELWLLFQDLQSSPVPLASASIITSIIIYPFILCGVWLRDDAALSAAITASSI